MQTKDEAPAEKGFGRGLLLLGLGVAIGALARPGRWLAPPDGEAVGPAGGGEKTPLHPYLRPAAEKGEPEVPDNGLATLGITLPPESARRLQEVRDRALARGVIVQEPEDTVPATLEVGGQSWPAAVRIKGDWTDHVETDKWSLRIELEEGTFEGMSTFSIQSPHTRGMLWEWVVLAAMRREDVLAPRADFVNVVINGSSAGVYYLEEHFSKELLESQRRREGAIVLWDEGTKWETILQSHAVPEKGLDLPASTALEPALRVGAAGIRAYGEKRLSSIDSLRRSLHGAVEKMRSLKDLALAADEDATSELRRLQALVDLQGETIDRLVDPERMARAHAVASLMQLRHPLAWHNMRFYHDPVLDRLEPIAFDNTADVPGGRDPVPLRAAEVVALFSRSPTYYKGVFRHLGRMCQPGYVDELFAGLEPALSTYEAALLAERNLPPSYTVAGMKQRLRTEQAYLRGVVFPVDPLNVDVHYELDPTKPKLAGWIEVEAWATTAVPVVVEGFRFANGTFLPAGEVLVQGLGASPEGRGVVPPFDGRPVRFRFSIDERLANLENVRQVKSAVREHLARAGQPDLDVDVVFRPLASQETQEEKLLLRELDPRWLSEPGRPTAPGLAEALAAHPFLEVDVESGRLSVRPGTWDVAGDLVVPAGHPLHVPAGTTLRFEEGRLLLTEDPLLVAGTAEEPVVFEPAPGAETFAGVHVLQAPTVSTWTHATVRRTAAVERGSWVTTGGVDFYHSPVELTDCRFEGTSAEDALNVFGTDIVLARVTIEGAASDSFDGDFVRGSIHESVFRDGASDGVDVSGSDVRLVRCRFERLGDKAVSAGERSRVTVVACEVAGVSLGVVSKDRSEVEVSDTTFADVGNWALAAYVKKPEYGPASLAARGVTVPGPPEGRAVCQTGCTLTIDGRAEPGRELDVDRLYREGVLGR